MKDNVGKDFSSLKFPRKNKVLNLSTVNTKIKNIANVEVCISPLLIFQRITLNITDQNDMKEYIKYELAPVPLALFNEGGMRKTKKSEFYDHFDSIDNIPATNDLIHIVDGGYFLHKVVWQSNENIETILNHYVSYAKRHYKPNSCIIFDGYPDDEALTTKSVERSRRKLASIGSEIHFDINTKITLNQKQFLSNEKNKIRLIQMLCTTLNSSGFRTKIAFEDADFLIVNSAIEHARIENQTTVVIVGEDICLLYTSRCV